METPTEQSEDELREKLFKLFFPYSDVKRVSDNELIDSVFEAFKSAGWIPPEEVEIKDLEWLLSCKEADELIKRAGYTLPEQK